MLTIGLTEMITQNITIKQAAMTACNLSLAKRLNAVTGTIDKGEAKVAVFTKGTNPVRTSNDVAIRVETATKSTNNDLPWYLSMICWVLIVCLNWIA